MGVRFGGVNPDVSACERGAAGTQGMGRALALEECFFKSIALRAAKKWKGPRKVRCAEHDNDREPYESAFVGSLFYHRVSRFIKGIVASADKIDAHDHHLDKESQGRAPSLLHCPRSPTGARRAVCSLLGVADRHGAGARTPIPLSGSNRARQDDQDARIPSDTRWLSAFVQLFACGIRRGDRYLPGTSIHFIGQRRTRGIAYTEARRLGKGLLIRTARNRSY